MATDAVGHGLHNLLNLCVFDDEGRAYDQVFSGGANPHAFVETVHENVKSPLAGRTRDAGQLHRPGQTHCTVGVDNREGGRLAGECLIAAGRKRLAFLGDTTAPELSERYLGLCDAARAAGLAEPIKLSTHLASDIMAEEIAGHIERIGAEIDGVAAASDLIAMHTVRALADRGLTNRTELTGAVEPAEIPALLARMDIAVAPYPDLADFYFSPLKVMEYMAAGRAVVASRIGDIDGLIRHGETGLLCAAGDRDALAQANEHFGGIDGLVNNAGGPPPGDFRDWEREAWIKALDANMLTPIELIKATVDGMASRGFGRIVNITSSAVKAPIDILGLSNGARSGLTGFVAGVARSKLAAQGVTRRSRFARWKLSCT